MKHLVYPKTYAVVTDVEWGGRPHSHPVAIVVTTGSSQRTRLLLRWRNGRGHCSGPDFAFDKGTVVKLYQMRGRAHLSFRRIGA